MAKIKEIQDKNTAIRTTAIRTTRVLDSAKKNKQDEFYTQLSDIEAELHHYKDQFKDKVIFCNCDDPFESNFFKYFAMNFNHLKLKKLIATCYINSTVVGKELPLSDIIVLEDKTVITNIPYKIEISEVTDENGDGAINLADVELLLKNKKNILTPLKGDGDFRSDECVELLKKSDIVVTNPPFSLFREYIAQLIEYDKKFIVIGNLNAITYKEIFKNIMNNKIWLGYGFRKGMSYFRVPETYIKHFAEGTYDKNTGLVKFGNINWYTNLDTTKRHESLTLYKKYTPEKYPHYDNYDAINVNKVAEIPCDWDGIIGVPITFIDKYNPEQFKIIRFRKGDNGKDLVVNGKNPYFRVLIKKEKEVIK